MLYLVDCVSFMIVGFRDLYIEEGKTKELKIMIYNYKSNLLFSEDMLLYKVVQRNMFFKLSEISFLDQVEVFQRFSNSSSIFLNVSLFSF